MKLFVLRCVHFGFRALRWLLAFDDRISKKINKLKQERSYVDAYISADWQTVVLEEMTTGIARNV